MLGTELMNRGLCGVPLKRLCVSVCVFLWAEEGGLLGPLLWHVPECMCRKCACEAPSIYVCFGHRWQVSSDQLLQHLHTHKKESGIQK